MSQAFGALRLAFAVDTDHHERRSLVCWALVDTTSDARLVSALVRMEAWACLGWMDTSVGPAKARR